MTTPSTELPPAPRFRRTTRWVVAIAMFGLLAYAAKLAHMRLYEEQYWFLLTPASIGDWNPADLPREDVWFNSADGTRLFGWFVPHERPRASLLFLHGSGGNIALPYQVEALRRLHELRLAIFVFDYRGFGRSEGQPSDEQSLCDDARAAQRWLSQRTGTPPDKILLLGRSLGASIAMRLAGEGGARAVIIENGSRSLVDVAARQYRWAPIRWMMRYRFEVAADFARYDGPFFQSQAEHDDLIPLDMAAATFAAARGRPREFFLAPDLDHGAEQPPEYYEALARFLDQVLGAAAAPPAQASQ